MGFDRLYFWMVMGVWWIKMFVLIGMGNVESGNIFFIRKNRFFE